MYVARAAVLCLAVLLFACGNRPPTDEASSAAMAVERRPSSAQDGAERVRILDDCDPATFDAVLGAGACAGDGETTFQQFIAELVATQTAEEWKFDDDRFDVKPGGAILAVNRGGETHTFTRVKEFGGGFVPELNALSGNPNPAPECSLPAVIPSFVPAGGSQTVTAPASGTREVPVLHPSVDARHGDRRGLI